MINKISINNVATYKEKSEILPKKINFLYGNNGSGKTTITKIIENPQEYTDSNIEWDNEFSDVLIYNREFVRINFNERTRINGIYTLGEDSQEKIDAIEELKKQQELINKNIEQNKKQLDIKIESRKKFKQDNILSFWNKYKKKYCDKMKETFKGNVSSMEKFFEKCLSIKDIDETISFEELQNEYNTLYSEELSEKSQIDIIKIDDINNIINDNIFRKEITENKNVTLSKLIEDLDNSLWIKDGIEYLKKSNNKCPFCQRELSKDFLQQIQKLYDEEYQKQIDNLNEKKEEFDILFNESKNLIENNSQIFDRDLNIEFSKYMDSIKKEIENKITNPKNICAFIVNNDIINKINDIIKKENIIIREQNNKIKNIEKSKLDLSTKAWNFIRTIANEDIKNYNKLYNEYSNEIKKLELEIKKDKDKDFNIIQIIHNIGYSISGITQTINNINNTLEQFNFNNFRLQENEDNRTYSIIRPNGEDASETLSEGEFSFISFLYFYYSVFGNKNKRGLTKKHILVIDDPVTSMDSNVLFIISTLIRNLIELCLENKKNIEQVFVLSHNIYFFKEVSYNYDNSKRKGISNNCNFFIIQKINDSTFIEDRLNENPVKNSYELLWQTLRKKDYTNESNLNVMRRILEQYFHTIGNMGPNNYNKDFMNKFEGKDKLVVKSLLSYINDGSHSIMDGIYMSPDVNLNENAFKIFKRIFEETGHINHYKMMMGEE